VYKLTTYKLFQRSIFNSEKRRTNPITFLTHGIQIAARSFSSY